MIQVIHRALAILEFISRHDKAPVQLQTIAEYMNLSQPTTANIVKSLSQKNYLEQVGRKVGYRLGVAAYQLTGNPSYDQDLINAAKEPMQEITSQLNETSLLAVIRNNQRVIVHLEEGNQVLQVRTTMVADVYSTSTGRLLMAFLPEKELDSLIRAIGLPSKKIWPGAETRERLNKVLDQIRKEELVQVRSVHHTVGFAVPVYKNKQVIAGLSVFVPESRYAESNHSKTERLIRKTARRISENLSGK